MVAAMTMLATKCTLIGVEFISVLAFSADFPDSPSDGVSSVAR